MKSLILVLLVPGLLFAILRAELTPWRLLSPSEAAALRNHIAQLEQTRSNGGSAPAGWLRDPNYRTSLEKTQVVGRPEWAKDRDR